MVVSMESLRRHGNGSTSSEFKVRNLERAVKVKLRKWLNNLDSRHEFSHFIFFRLWMRIFLEGAFLCVVCIACQTLYSSTYNKILVSHLLDQLLFIWTKYLLNISMSFWILNSIFSSFFDVFWKRMSSFANLRFYFLVDILLFYVVITYSMTVFNFSEKSTPDLF